MTVHDVIVAGAGPAGSVIAKELAADGFSVLMLDAAKFPRDKVCGDFVSPRGLSRIKNLGCFDAVQAHGCTPIRSSRLYLNRELLVSGSLPHVEGLGAYGLAVPRRELDATLYQAALCAGAKSVEGCRVEGFIQTSEGVDVSTIRDGQRHQFQGRMVIGADGATSAVAKTAGLRMNDDRHTLVSIRAYAEGLTLDHTLMYFDEKYFPGYGWIFPVRPGLCNIGVGMVKEPIVRGGLNLRDFYERFTRFVQKVGDAKGTRIEIGPSRGWPIPTYGGARKNYFERGLLVGDAGSFVDPINGEGIPLAMESASLAAQTVRRAFKLGRFDESTLAHYQDQWRSAFDPDLRISDLVVSLIRNRTFLPVWLKAFRTMSLTANGDAHYASIAGGVLGGVVPARKALTPEMFIRAMVHTPAFWRKAMELPTSPMGWLQSGARLARWQIGVGRAVMKNPREHLAWTREIEAKQRRVLQSL